VEMIKCNSSKLSFLCGRCYSNMVKCVCAVGVCEMDVSLSCVMYNVEGWILFSTSRACVSVGVRVGRARKQR
jgi:hypothetical protein